MKGRKNYESQTNRGPNSVCHTGESRYPVPPMTDSGLHRKDVSGLWSLSGVELD
jgi:hypothetical protein